MSKHGWWSAIRALARHAKRLRDERDAALERSERQRIWLEVERDEVRALRERLKQVEAARRAQAAEVKGILRCDACGAISERYRAGELHYCDARNHGTWRRFS